ncbi:MAG: NUDIX domain-containing protein [Planctomycetales bacterium]|nr:NUDIX domain-containing protein [Planctomycetales bacterium]
MKEIAIAIVHWGELYLVGRRPDHATQAGKCEFPGGKVEPGEDPARAAQRECLEETGLEIVVSQVHSVQVEHYGSGALRLHFYTAEVPAHGKQPPPVPPPWRWVPRQELNESDFPSGNRFVIRELRGHQR